MSRVKIRRMSESIPLDISPTFCCPSKKQTYFVLIHNNILQTRIFKDLIIHSSSLLKLNVPNVTHSNIIFQRTEQFGSCQCFIIPLNLSFSTVCSIC